MTQSINVQAFCVAERTSKTFRKEWIWHGARQVGPGMKPCAGSSSGIHSGAIKVRNRAFM
jgi:hypothetical protein